MAAGLGRGSALSTERFHELVLSVQTSFGSSSHNAYRSVRGLCFAKSLLSPDAFVPDVGHAEAHMPMWDRFPSSWTSERGSEASSLHVTGDSDSSCDPSRCAAGVTPASVQGKWQHTLLPLISGSSLGSSKTRLLGSRRVPRGVEQSATAGTSQCLLACLPAQDRGNLSTILLCVATADSCYFWVEQACCLGATLPGGESEIRAGGS